MPQFDVSTYISQMFWVLLIFFCYWLVMDKLIIPRIAEMIEFRKRKYDDFIQKAEEINKKAQTSLQQYEKTLAAARAEASSQIAKNEKELRELISQKESEIKNDLAQKMTEHENKLAREKEKLLKKIDKMSINVALVATKQLNLPSITRADIDEVANKGANNVC